ncbi:hypothetical protein RvY_11870 [Ramazzottius varieornatus]|uniref:Uncharacterized protein n=1 Tax=Ramazzottius varieornatus TaxID=947166 RepID=A0A1D1VMY0_RAMVA|nr:hypothetical protein RvY_11870 [Ramazzottius varieornatus]
MTADDSKGNDPLQRQQRRDATVSREVYRNQGNRAYRLSDSQNYGFVPGDQRNVQPYFGSPQTEVNREASFAPSDDHHLDIPRQGLEKVMVTHTPVQQPRAPVEELRAPVEDLRAPMEEHRAPRSEAETTASPVYSVGRLNQQWDISHQQYVSDNVMEKITVIHRKLRQVDRSTRMNTATLLTMYRQS